MSNSIGDLKNSGLQGNNFPWQLKMLEGLQKIYDEVKKPLTCAEDSITICNTSSIPVTIDCNDRISLCVNGAIVNSANALPVTITNALPLEVNINQANDSILIYGFDGTANQPISVGANGFVNVNATVTFPPSLAVTQSTSPWVVSTNSITRLPAILRVTGAGTIAPGARSFSILNAGSGIGSILGGVNNLLPGEEVDFAAGGNDVFGLISFNGNGVTTLVVTYVS